MSEYLLVPRRNGLMPPPRFAITRGAACRSLSPFERRLGAHHHTTSRTRATGQGWTGA